MIIITIIGLDQSTKKSGYSIWIDGKLIYHGVLDSNVKENNYIKRIKITSDLIEQLIDKYKPDYVAIEGVQYQRNLETYHQLSCNQGCIMDLLFKRHIPFEIVPVNRWRSYNGIKGNEKREKQKATAIALVQKLYNIEVSDDESEAILIGRYVAEKSNYKGEIEYDS